MTDQTKQKQAEVERKNLQAQHEQAQTMEMVGRLAGGVAHDFNNLLMGLRSYAALCRETLDPGHPILESLGEITSAAQRSADRVRQLLVFAGQQTLAPKILDINSQAESPRGRGETILLVDDEKSVRVMCGRFLKSLNYKVLMAETPGEALKMTDGHPGDIHALLTDVAMPEMDGGQLAKRITAVRPGIKVLFMSGYIPDAIAERSLPGEGEHFITKPFTRNDLAHKMREILKKT